MWKTQVFTCKYLHTCCLLTWLTTEVQHQDSPGLPLLFQPCCWMPLVTYRNQFFFHHVMSSVPLGSCWWLQPALARSSGRETAGCLLEADTNHPSAQRGPVPPRAAKWCSQQKKWSLQTSQSRAEGFGLCVAEIRASPTISVLSV